MFKMDATLTEDAEHGDRKHVTVIYHQVSYQGEETSSRSQLSTGSSKSDEETYKVQDYLPFAILSVMIFLPVGALSLMYSVQVTQAVKKKDMETAVYSSTWAIQHALIAYFIGSIVIMLTLTVSFIYKYSI